MLRRHGSSTAAVARALVRVRFLHEERESLQQRLQVRCLPYMSAHERLLENTIVSLMCTKRCGPHLTS